MYWSFDGESKEVVFQAVVSNFLLLKSNGIAVIEGEAAFARVLILNPDGSVRTVLKSPFNVEECVIPYYFNYEDDNLVLVFAGRSGDFVCQVDEMSGILSEPRYTR